MTSRPRSAWMFPLGLIPLAVAALVFGSAHAAAQQTLDRLKALPGFEEFTRMQDQLSQAPAFVSGALSVTWADDSRTFTYARSEMTHRFDVATRTDTEITYATAARANPLQPHAPERPDPCPFAIVDRGRQRPCEASPDRTMKAYSRDRNVYLSKADGSGEMAISSDGSDRTRIKYGVASWVYGEELDQTTAIWWSPDGTKIAFYRFDESRVPDYYLQMDQTRIQDSLDVEAFPQAGTDNPVADVLVYDLASRRTTTLDVRDGRPFADDVIGHYVFAMEWAPDSSELRMHRTNRRQQILEFVGCSPSTAKCRVIVRDEWPTGWVENRPEFRPLGDGRRFIWASDRTGWRNYYLYDFSGTLITPITAHTAFDADKIVKVDERAGVMFYLARDGDNFMKMQLHRVGLDGRGDVRLTDPAFTHAVSISPDGKYFVDVRQTHVDPPVTSLVTSTGALVADVARSELTRFRQLGLRQVEMFSYRAADKRTTLYGSIAFPSNFDPAKTYPTLVEVYGGPESALNTPSELFLTPSPTTEYGLLVVSLSSRAVPGLGRRTLDSLYLKLGQTEVDDMAEGIKALSARPYFDKARVGIYGTSYGGYVALMELLRYPDLFAAASASSPVTDWRHYDTIYTERYMWLPAKNQDGYDRGSAMTYAKNLAGRLLIYYGTADNNVHPNNTLQLIQALNWAGKSFEVQVGPDASHTQIGTGRMMEFFLENLVAYPERLRIH